MTSRANWTLSSPDYSQMLSIEAMAELKVVVLAWLYEWWIWAPICNIGCQLESDDLLSCPDLAQMLCTEASR